MQGGSPYGLVFSTAVIALVACGGAAPVDRDPQLPSIVPIEETSTNAVDDASKSALTTDTAVSLDTSGAATDSDGFDSRAIDSDSFDAGEVESGAGGLDAGTPLDSASSEGGAISCYEVKCTRNSDCSTPCTRCNLFGRCSVL